MAAFWYIQSLSPEWREGDNRGTKRLPACSENQDPPADAELEAAGGRRDKRRGEPQAVLQPEERRWHRPIPIAGCFWAWQHPWRRRSASSRGPPPRPGR